MRPPLRIRKTKKRRVVQEAGSRPSNYEPGSQFPSERQMNRYQQEQGADQQYNHYARSSTTPREAEAAQRRKYHIYSTDSPGNCLKLIRIVLYALFFLRTEVCDINSMIL